MPSALATAQGYHLDDPDGGLNPSVGDSGGHRRPPDMLGW